MTPRSRLLPWPSEHKRAAALCDPFHNPDGFTLKFSTIWERLLTICARPNAPG